MTTILEAIDISHQFIASDGSITPSLEGVTLHLTKGSFTCLIGASGSGKSTLLRILAGLIKPTSGHVLYEGKALTRPQKKISVIFQTDNLMPWRTVAENIALPLQLAGMNLRQRQDRVQHLIELTGLTGFEKQYPAELSGGMAQRVAIARGLITEPEVLLLDEPFGALDSLTREEMWDELLRLWSTTQATVLMVTHSIEEATFLADQVFVFSPRPATITATFDIPFERPHALPLLTDMAFHQTTASIRAVIRR